MYMLYGIIIVLSVALLLACLVDIIYKSKLTLFNIIVIFIAVTPIIISTVIKFSSRQLWIFIEVIPLLR